MRAMANPAKIARHSTDIATTAVDRRLSAGPRRASAFRALSLAAIVAATSPAAQAEVKATDAWVRATVPTQKSTGAFVTLTSTEDARLVGVASPAAALVELHSSSMEKGVMQMRALEAIELPAGKAVDLRPGGMHIMLTGLAKPVAAGGSLPLTFTIEDKRGKRTRLEVNAAVRPIGSR
jgi:periplasmic copper chaperone A